MTELPDVVHVVKLSTQQLQNHNSPSYANVEIAKELRGLVMQHHLLYRSMQLALMARSVFMNKLQKVGTRSSSGFCANCGSPMLNKTTKMPEMFFFHAGTMDDPSLFKPEMVVYQDSRQPWDYVDPDIPRK